MKSPIFIVGPPRSGTKILRDTLQRSGSTQTKEHNLNHVWNIQELPKAHEEFSVESLTPKIKRKIRENFESHFSLSAGIPVEKNVHHSLRIQFVAKVFPEAKFLIIRRHGLDSICSIQDRWKSPVEWQYFLKNKILDISPQQILYYSFKNLKKYLAKTFSAQDKVDNWGPRIKGLSRLLEIEPLLKVCTIQWKRCAENLITKQLDRFNINYRSLKYESLMTESDEILSKVVNFLGLRKDVRKLREFADSNYRKDSIGRWRNDLTQVEIDEIRPIIEQTLDLMGYYIPK